MILSENQTQEIVQKILKQIRLGEEAEITISNIDSSLTRYANNIIHQNVNENSTSIMLYLYSDKRRGFAMTTRTDESSLQELAASARLVAEASAENPDMLGPADPVDIAKITCWDEETAQYSAQSRARRVGALCQEAERKGLNAYGVFITGEGGYTFANSRGIFAHHRTSWSEYSATLQKGEASVRAEGSAVKIADLDIEGLGREALAKMEIGSELRKIEPGEYTVILDPYATADLVFMLAFHGMSAEDYLEGRSWMNDRSGQLTMKPSVNIWDDGLDPSGIPLPFDFEGSPRQRVDFVKAGVVGGPVHSRRTALQAGTSTTGHATPPMGESDAPLPMNLFMGGGGGSVGEMIKSTEHGLYITRFWYTRLMHPRDCVITGMTRDGVYMIEDGKLVYSVKNLRFVQPYVTALNNVEDISSDTRLLRNDLYNFYISCRVPAVKINGFKFTGTTM